MTHDLKIHPEHFKAIRLGDKTCEVRVNDRDYKLGEFLCLNEWDPLDRQYSGRVIHARITHIIPIKIGEIAEYSVMSIKLVEPLIDL